MFLAITHRLDSRQRQRAAIRAVIAAGGLILGFAIFGELVLRYLEVSIESLSIAGGLLLLLVALGDAARHRLPDRRLGGRRAGRQLATPARRGAGGDRPRR